jgi:hypothetical protein
MEYYIITDLIKYVISDYLSYHKLISLNNNIFRCNQRRYSEVTSEGLITKYVDDTVLSMDFYGLFKYPYRYKNIGITSWTTNDNKVYRVLKTSLRKYYNDNSTLKHVWYNDSGIQIVKSYNRGFLHIIWIGNVCYHFYQSSHTNKKNVKYWWENYISVIITYSDLNKKSKISSKYFNRDGICTRHKIYKQTLKNLH